MNSKVIDIMVSDNVIDNKGASTYKTNNNFNTVFDILQLGNIFMCFIKSHNSTYNDHN